MRYKVIGLLGVAFSLGVVQAASAADMPVKARIAVPGYNWTGFYVGLNAGGVWANSAVDWTTDGSSIGPIITDTQTGSIKMSGFTGGGQLGFNHQINNLVWGLEVDFNYTGLSGSRATSIPPPIGANMLSTVESRWFSSLRARLGWAHDRLLVYVTGGPAIGNVKVFDISYGAPDFFGSRNVTRVGSAVGGGFEWALNPNWSVRAEYLHVNLGRVSYDNLCSTAFGCTSGVVLSHNLREDIARVGINYRFGQR
jgi:outer membrane immunogenic protein